MVNSRPGWQVRARCCWVEVPEWVAQDTAKLGFGAPLRWWEQSRVSDGFPYVLMRAHELAGG